VRHRITNYNDIYVYIYICHARNPELYISRCVRQFVYTSRIALQILYGVRIVIEIELFNYVRILYTVIYVLLCYFESLKKKLVSSLHNIVFVYNYDYRTVGHFVMLYKRNKNDITAMLGYCYFQQITVFIISILYSFHFNS